MNIVGVMSGTSLDGIDLVLCSFAFENGKWSYTVGKSETMQYSDEWKNKLASACNLGGQELMLLHNEYGSFIGRQVLSFLGGALKADLVASHGHTVFHQPENKLTFQLGNAPCIAAECGVSVVADFRSTDVALGGQGAPLVPVGDSLLFSGYGYCLNLGGFANVSHDFNGIRIACDLCPVNIVANELAMRLGLEYDTDGNTGAGGKLIEMLVDELNNLSFYNIKGPKSLGREWVENIFMPVINKYEAPVPDLLRSFYEHVSDRISDYINTNGAAKVLVTGGGAFNKFLNQRLQDKSKVEFIIPDKQVVMFKEAIIFAFLGLLRYTNRINCLSSVTGASADSSTGGIYLNL